MAHFTYRARNQDGQIIKGDVEASSEDKAITVLTNNNLIPIDIEKAEKKSIFNQPVFGSPVSTKDLILFCREFASMIRAGVQILTALRALANETSKPAYRNVLLSIANDIEAGESLSAAMGKHYKVFSPFFLGVVRIGESSGQLAYSLESIADYLEQDYIFMRKVWAALTYPAIVLLVVAILVTVMFMFVLPQLISLFDDADVTLPWATRVLIAITEFLQAYWWLLLILLVSLAAVLRSYVKTPEGGYSLSVLLLTLPGLSTLFQKIYLARLTAVMHTLFKSDLPVIESLELTKNTVGSKVYARILDDTANAVKDGASISSVWKHEPFIMPMLTAMVAVGEKSGNLAQSFTEANRFFTRDITTALDTLSTLLEPLLIIILCVGVGIVVAAILMPIYNLVLVL